MNIYLRVEIEAQEFGSMAFVYADAQEILAVVNAGTFAFRRLAVARRNFVYSFAGKRNGKIAAVANGFYAVAGNIGDQVAVMIYVNNVAGN